MLLPVRLVAVALVVVVAVVLVEVEEEEEEVVVVLVEEVLMVGLASLTQQMSRSSAHPRQSRQIAINHHRCRHHRCRRRRRWSRYRHRPFNLPVPLRMKHWLHSLLDS